jgi:hypothetical protein
MNLRGEFIRGDGLVIPNQLTVFGAATLLSCAFSGAQPALYMGLCDAVPDSSILESELNEPTLGVNGYARQQVNNGTLEVTSQVDSAYIAFPAMAFVATGAGFSKPIRRPFFGFNAALTPAANIFCLGSPIPSPLTILPATPIQQRTFSYRLYLR